MDCSYRKVTAFVRPDVLGEVEAALQAIHVRGITVSMAKGYGEYVNFFERDWMEERVRVEIFVCADEVTRVVETILTAASTGGIGDGIVSVLPVEQVWRIRDRALLRRAD